MSAKKTRTSGIVAFVEETGEKLAPMPDMGRPYILESAEFDAFVSRKRNAAQREIDALDGEISRLQVEIEARLDRRRDLMAVVIKADAALGVKDRPTPTLEQRSDAA